MHKFYLGDGVYAEVERGMIKLTTRNGYGQSATIFLESEVVEALIQYVGRMKRIFAEQRQAAHKK